MPQAPIEASREEEQWEPFELSGPKCSILLEPKLERGIVAAGDVEAFSLPALQRLNEMETDGLAAVDPQLLSLRRLEPLGSLRGP